MWPRCSHGCQPLLRRLAATKIVWIQVLLKQPQRLKALCGALWRWGQKYYVMNETPSEVAWSMRRRARKCSQAAHKWQHSEPCSGSRERRVYTVSLVFFRYRSAPWRNRRFDSQHGERRVQPLSSVNRRESGTSRQWPVRIYQPVWDRV